MDTKLLILILNGLTQAAIFFVLGSGLTLAFGLMRVINLSHGAFYLLGGYIGYSVVRATGNWPLALVAGGLSIALFGFLFERTMLIRVRGGDLPETLLTVALSILLDEPSEGVAPVAIQRVVETCRELRKANISILLVEQNVHVAAAFAERIYILLSGRTVYESAATTFLENLELRQKYLGV